MKKRERTSKRNWKLIAASILLGMILVGCLCSEWFLTTDPSYLNLTHTLQAPNKQFLFGTDTLGRDIFSMIWAGGKVSLLIGILATMISTVLAILIGTLAGLAPTWIDDLLMRIVELLLSIPSLLLTLFLLAFLGRPTVLIISIVIGITNWFPIAKVVRAEVRKLRVSEFVLAARCMGGSFFYILRVHLLPNFIASIQFMIIMNVRSAILTESTLSFLGLGLPLEIISWGSMLSFAEDALLRGAWWMILIPGGFLTVTLLCITFIANQYRVNREADSLDQQI